MKRFLKKLYWLVTGKPYQVYPSFLANNVKREVINPLVHEFDKGWTICFSIFCKKLYMFRMHYREFGSIQECEAWALDNLDLKGKL